MNLKSKLAAVLAAAALPLTPAVAPAEGPVYAPTPAPEHPTKPPMPGPSASLPEKTKAYGVYSKGFSKEHVKGQVGTEFSRCITAAAKAKKTAAR